MSNNLYRLYCLLLLLFMVSPTVNAQDSRVSRPDSHAPIGVMGDHLHKKGEFMVSYRFMRMFMEDNRDGTDDLGPEDIVTTVPNRFFGMPMQPPTIRVVPTEMTMDMHMFGVMYAPSDNVTLMGMAMVLNNTMDHITFQGGMGTNRLGEFTTDSGGFGDLKLAALVRLTDHLHLNAGISLPTGSIEEEDQVLTPLNAEPILRLPYPMQIGSGTWDLLPGITYANNSDNFGWGSQLSAVLRLGENDNDFAYGGQFQATVWGSYLFTNWLSTSLRFKYTSIGEIDGIDSGIVAPVQTANPDFQGGNRVDGSIGFNIIGTGGFVKNQRLAAEFAVPFLQDLNGPQLETPWVLTLGWQYAF